ncbi:MAG: selenocysteine-specific translation elongation factor [Sulfobacillus acidophilus]|uniref:Selenocysteine-specific elongation factor n=1 Tax=Sulfobacillus acidophilus TaxID=53633 RepID=A0A2T2WPC8_9FIRM|nr:MAG: selenocysteine-specific translation elongation factor [Sulfobacillus acidophilus]
MANLYPVIVGTAGHIDHGKTTLVKALTGQDADRLPEEKARGITIDLGFAHMRLASGQRVAFIDVPGHERFVRNMVAGVHGMDAVLLVVAADEGIMPQTEEHLAILRLLGVQRGLTVITKADLVDAEMRALVHELVVDAIQGTFLENAPVVTVDAITGRGINELKMALHELVAGVKRQSVVGPVRLPIDRVFTVKGFGTVVTGTLVSGRIQIEDSLEVVPDGLMVRVRGVQVHNRAETEALSGQRVALNIAGVSYEDVKRGSVLASKGTLRGVNVFTAALELLATSPVVNDNVRVHVHSGTAQALGRIYLIDSQELRPQDTGFVEIRLESALALARRDRFLIRSYSPVVTIGGGVALEVGIHHRRREPGLMKRLERLFAGDDAQAMYDLIARSPMPVAAEEVAARLGLTPAQVMEMGQSQADVIALEGRYLWVESQLLPWDQKARAILLQYVQDRPIKPGMPIDELKSRMAHDWPPRIFRAALQHQGWFFDREWVRLTVEPAPISGQDLAAIQSVYEAVRTGELNPSRFDEIKRRLTLDEKRFEDIVEYLFLQGCLLRLEDGLAMSREAYEQGKELVAQAIRRDGPKSTAELKEALQVNRRLAVLFLELLDRQRVTRRSGDKRELVP